MAKKHYESYIIIDGNLEENQIEEVISKFEKFLNNHKAENFNTEKIGRRRLAYAIQKRQNGYYVCFYFDAVRDLVSELERNYRLDENILRFLTLHVDNKTIEEREEYFKMKADRKAEEDSKLESGSEETAKVQKIDEINLNEPIQTPKDKAAIEN